MATIKVRWTVAELANVMTQFDVQKVYRATSPTGPWNEITGAPTRVALVAGEESYYYDDTGGSATDYYAISYFHSSTLLESSLSDAIRGDLAGAEYLTVNDLYQLVGQRRAQQYFDDDIDGEISDEGAAVNAILETAEAHVASVLRRSWSTDQITDLMNADRAAKVHAAWVALELAAERRPEFCAEDGKGHFSYQFERAMKFFDALSKGKTRSVGESAAGAGANIGGAIQPTLTEGASRFVFAPDDDNPTGHGGF